MPDPDTLRGYEELVTGAAERILAMAESSTTHRATTESKLADSEIKNAEHGRIQAFALTLIALVAAIVFFAIDNTVAGGVLLSLPVVMLIKAFFPGSRSQD